MTPIIHRNTSVMAPAAIVHSKLVAESKITSVYLATSVLSSWTKTLVTMLNTNCNKETTGTSSTRCFSFVTLARCASAPRACTAWYAKNIKNAIMIIIGAAEAGLSDIKAVEECSAIVNSSAFSKMDRKVRSWRCWAMLGSVPTLVFATYIAVLAIAFRNERAISPDTTDVLFQYDLYHQMPVTFYHGPDRGSTYSYAISFNTAQHYHAMPAEQAKPALEHLLLYNKKTVEYVYLPAAQNVFSVSALIESLGGAQISFCQSNVFAGNFPKPCTRSKLHNAACNGPLPSCSITLCREGACAEPLNRITFSFDAHSGTHVVPESWPKQHDLHVDILHQESETVSVVLDTSDATYNADSHATLSLPKLKTPFALNSSTLTLYEGIVEDSDLESIAYSIISALLFSVWVFSTTQNGGNAQSPDSGISALFYFNGNTIAVNFDLCAAIIKKIEQLQIIILFNTTLSICVGSAVALLYEIYNGTVYTYVNIELAIIFSHAVQTVVIFLYTALGIAPFLLTGPIFLSMLSQENRPRTKRVIEWARSLTGYNNRETRAYLLVTLRMILEIQFICAFQIHVPPSSGTPFQNTVSLALGVTLLVIIGRDLALLFYARPFQGPAWAQVVTWFVAVCAILYSAVAMITPILWSTQIADHTDILAISAAITSCTLLMGSVIGSRKIEFKQVSKPGPANFTKNRRPTEISQDIKIKL